MTPEKQLEIYRELDEKLIKLTTSKRTDYAGADVLSNFKNVSGAAKALEIKITKPEQYALFMVLLKIARITNLLNSGKTPSNEAVADSFEDAINYMKLAYCCHKDNETI